MKTYSLNNGRYRENVEKELEKRTEETPSRRVF